LRPSRLGGWRRDNPGGRIWVPQPCGFQGAIVDLSFHCSFHSSQKPLTHPNNRSMFIFGHSLQTTQPNLTPMLSFRVFVAQHPRPPLVARRFTLPVNISTHRCPRIIEAPVMERIS